MNPPSEDLKNVLVAAGIGTFGATSGWGIFIGKEPDKPNTAITLYDTGGYEPNPKWLQDNPTVQVRVRGTNYKTTLQKAKDARDALLGIGPNDFPASVTTTYVGIWVSSDVGYIGSDDKNRFIFTFNLRITIEPASGAYRESLT